MNLKKNWNGIYEYICWDRALVVWKKNLPGRGLTKIEKNCFRWPVCNVRICKAEYFGCCLPVASTNNGRFAKTMCGSCSTLCAMELPVQHRPSLAICLHVVRTYVRYLAEDPLTTAQEANFLVTKKPATPHTLNGYINNHRARNVGQLAALSIFAEKICLGS